MIEVPDEDEASGQVVEAPRTSSRATAGVPPQRFGNLVPQPTKKYKKKEAQTQATRPPFPPTSTRSTSSARMKKQAEVDAETQIAILESEFDEKQKAVLLLQTDLNKATKQVEFYEAAASMDQRDSVKEKLEEVQTTKNQLEDDYSRAKINLQFEQKELERKKKSLLNVAELAKLQIDEDSSSECGSMVDKSIDTDKWAEETTKQKACGHQPSEDEEPDTPDLRRRLKKLTEFPPVPVNQATAKSHPSSTEKMLARHTQGRDLPPFHGRPEEWPSFISAYETTSNNCYYTNADNLPRLQRALRGEALRTVQCLLINPEAVPKVIEKLRMRFGRPTQIIEAMIQKVREVNPVKIDRSDTYVEFGIAVDNLVSTIVAMKKPEDLRNPTLIQELTKKLPLITQMDWVEKRSTDNPSLEEFATWVNRYTEAACELCPVQPVHETSKFDKKKNRRQSERVFQTNEEKGNNKEPRSYQKQKKKCVFCNQDHPPRDCPDFKKENPDKRQELVKTNRACFGCLIKGHRIKECRSKRECGTDGCKQKHHPLLHQERRVEPAIRVLDPKDESSGSEDINCATDAVHSIHTGRINFMMAPVKLNGPDGIIDGFVVLDNYSSITSIESSTAESIGAPGRVKPLNVKGFGGSSRHPESRAVKVKLIHNNEPEVQFELKNVRTVERLDLPMQSVTRENLQKWKHLDGLDIEPYSNAHPTILVGMDNPQLHIHLEYRTCRNPNAPIAVRTPLGWMLMGKLDSYSKQDHVFATHEEELHELVKSFFTTESFGVMPNAPKPKSRDDQRAQSIMDSTLRRVSDGWEVGLLWKDDTVCLPQSKGMAFHRLRTMEKRMDRDPEFAQQYVERITQYQSKGFARKLDHCEASKETPKTFYLPHFMAYNPKKPKKFRFVFDAAAQIKGRSLNSFLLQGPDKLASLPGILLKFRQRKIGITADIQDMFHRVRVKQDDAQAQRFLWRGMDCDRPPDVMEMGVLIFGAACSPACAQEAKNCNALDLQLLYPEAYDPIVKKHYVDDYLNSHDTEAEAIKSQEVIRKVHSLGGFNLCNWLCSSRKVMNSIPEELRAKSMKSMDIDGEFPTERVLGLFWKPNEDAFTFSLNFLKGQEQILKGRKVPTKREILSLVMSLYDPLGFLSILTFKAKILIQTAWRKQLAWDDPIPDEVCPQWDQWLEELEKIPSYRLPRCYWSNFSTADEIQLHVFGDASEESFGAVCYFRMTKDDEVHVSLVMSKSKVAPIKVLSMPRLELQAAVMGTRLAAFIKEETEVTIHRIIYWTDSSTVMNWIQSDGRKFQQFVSHRIGEIQEVTEVGQWRWLPTHLNVADEMTRFNKPCDWSPSSRWINGPSFLKQPETQWPSQEDQQPVNPTALELRKQYVMVVGEIEESPINISRFSKWWRLIRTTSYVLRIIQKAKKTEFPIGMGIRVDEIANAEKYWWKLVQQQFFPEEIYALKENQPLKKGSKLFKINVMLDHDHVMRVKGRIEKADVSSSLKHPVVLDKRSPYTQMMIMHYHQLCGHHGQERIGNEIRQMFYIPGLRHEIRATQNRCQVCKNARAKPRIPVIGQLPTFRLEKNVRPFTKTGLDYFGPIEVVVKRSREKRYVALFTCLSIRAIHLEIASSLSSDACIMALRRFVSRRGCPEAIHSDNGTNFHGANNELKAALMEMDQDKMNEECSKKGIKWNYNPPSASHFGGSWERMVRSVKVALGDVLQSKALKEELLHTLLIEAEHTVNSHPLTHVPDDPEDREALTPNHFLLGSSSNLQPIGQFTKDDLYGRREWRIVQQMADQFWRRWVREFLPTLLRREKWCQPARPIQEGDIIIEINENLHRNFWPKGRVTKTFPGEDGVIRVVDIQHSNGKTYRRPVTKLCVLDLEVPVQIQDNNVADN